MQLVFIPFVIGSFYTKSTGWHIFPLTLQIQTVEEANDITCCNTSTLSNWWEDYELISSSRHHHFLFIFHSLFTFFLSIVFFSFFSKAENQNQNQTNKILLWTNLTLNREIYTHKQNINDITREELWAKNQSSVQTHSNLVSSSTSRFDQDIPIHFIQRQLFLIP